MSEITYRDCPMCDARRGAVGKPSESGKCIMFRCSQCGHRFAGSNVAPDRRLAWDVLDPSSDEPAPKNWTEVYDYNRYLGNDFEDDEQ
jgi:hypothetical protein